MVIVRYKLYIFVLWTFYVPPPKGRGHIDFGADPVGVGIGVTLVCTIHLIFKDTAVEKLKIHGGGGEGEGLAWGICFL